MVTDSHVLLRMKVQRLPTSISPGLQENSLTKVVTSDPDLLVHICRRQRPLRKSVIESERTLTREDNNVDTRERD